MAGAEDAWAALFPLPLAEKRKKCEEKQRWEEATEYDIW